MFQIEQLPAPVGQRCQAPAALADCLAVLVLPVKGTLLVPFVFILKQGYEAARLVAYRFYAITTIEGGI